MFFEILILVIFLFLIVVNLKFTGGVIVEQGIVVLLPASEIFTDDLSQSSSPEIKGNLSNGRPVYSTGRLEKALAGGHRVLVASTRFALCSHDKWWVSLVGRKNVFLSDTL